MKQMTDRLRYSIASGKIHRKRNIYLVGQEVLAKAGKEETVKNELEIGQFCHREGLSVPEMYGIVEPDSPEEVPSLQRPIKDWFVLMQRIKGKTLSYFRGEDLRELVIKRKGELEKVVDLGIIPGDCLYCENTMVDRNGTIYLIDFEAWHRGSESDLKSVREEIEIGTEKFLEIWG